MSTLKIFSRGFLTAIRKARLVLYVWLATVLFSLIISAPLYFLLGQEFSRSLAGDWLDRGPILLWLGDLIYQHQDAFPLLAGWIVIPTFLFLVFYVFLNGGMLGRIAVNERVNLPTFLSDSGRYFWRFIRVFFLSILGYVLILGILGAGVSAILRIWIRKATSQWPTIAASLLRLLIFLLLYSIVKMFFDYVKVRLVVTESKKTIGATLANFNFLGRRFFRAWGLFILCGLVFIGLSVVYYLGAKAIPATGIIPLGILFLWQQAYILALAWTAVLFFSTEYEFFKVHQYGRAERS